MRDQDKEEADKNAVYVTYELLVDGKYELAKKVLLSCYKEIKINEKYKNKIIINLAQAYKWLNDEKSMNSLLDKYEWSEKDDIYKFAFEVLKDNYKNAYALLPKIKDHDSYDIKTVMCEWPLLQKMRKEKRFKKIYKNITGEEFNASSEVTKEELLD